MGRGEYRKLWTSNFFESKKIKNSYLSCQHMRIVTYLYLFAREAGKYSLQLGSCVSRRGETEAGDTTNSVPRAALQALKV